MARTGRLTLIPIITLLTLSLESSATWADGGNGDTTVHGDDHGNAVVLQTQQLQNELNADGAMSQDVGDASADPTHLEPACDDHGGTPYNEGTACAKILRCDDGNGYLVQEVTNTDPPRTLNTYCVTAEELQQIAPTVTPGLVLTALRRIPLPAAEMSIQPPGHRAPVNFDVIFSTGARILTPTVTLLGQKVYLKIAPVTYRWVPGDGSGGLATDWEGQPYQRGDLDMGDYVSHRYERAEVVWPRVDVTYAAEFSVGGADSFQPVPGAVTVEGTPTALTIVEAAGVLNRGVSTRGSTGHQGSPEPGVRVSWAVVPDTKSVEDGKECREDGWKAPLSATISPTPWGVGACVSGGTDVA